MRLNVEPSGMRFLKKGSQTETRRTAGMKKELSVQDESARFSMDYLISVVADRYIHNESKVEYQDLYFGYVDAWASVDGNIHLFDLKTGYGSTEDHVAQQEGYALALLNGAREGAWPSVTNTKTATLHLIWEDQRRTWTWTVSYEQAKAKVMEILAKRMTPDIKPRANKNCQWCAKLTECEAVNHEVIEAVRSGLPRKFDNPDHLSRAMMVGDLATAWAADIRKLGAKHVAEGGELKDYRHSRCKGREVAPELKDAWAACKEPLEAEHGENAKDIFLTVCKVSVSKLRNLFKGKDFPVELKRGEPYTRLTCKKRLLK